LKRSRDAASLADRFAELVALNRDILGALLIVTAVSFIVEMGYLAPRSETVRLALRAERLSHVAMLDEETGVRGYLLTHDQRFLEPYENGQRDLLLQTERLTGALSAFPELARDFVEVRVSQQAWQVELADSTVANRPVDLHRGRQLFDIYRVHQGRFEQLIEARLNTLVRGRTRLLALGGIIQIILFGLAMWISHRRLRRLQEQVGRPVAAVVDAIHAVRQGFLGPVKFQPGPEELTEIQVGLGDMIAALTSERAAREARTRDADERAAVLRQILDSAREFSGSLNVRYVLRTLGRAACASTGAARAAIWLFAEDGRQLRMAFDTESKDGISTDAAVIEMGAGLVGRAARYARTVTPDAASGGLGDAPPLQDEMAVPLIVGARVVGVMQLVNGGVAGLGDDRREILEILASHGAAAVESARLHQTVEERSYRDALTKLYNRRRLEEDLETELKRSRRYGSPLSFVMLDVDHFKRFNDTYGHGKGDQILEELGNLLDTTVRNTDTAYRYGGEEFSVLLRETYAPGAAEFAERLRRRIEEHFQSTHPASPVTASIGVATFSSDMRGP